MTDCEPSVPAATPPLDYGRTRRWSVPTFSLDPFPHLKAAWTDSRRVLNVIADSLQERALDERIVTIALSGSLGRMEAHARSDADIMVIVRDASELGPGDDGKLMSDLWKRLASLPVDRPDPDGIFVNPTDARALSTVTSLGVINESAQVFGTRMQLLLDAQPVYATAEFDCLLRDIIGRYTSAAEGGYTNSPWTCLTHDLIRYYRCLGLDAYCRRRDDPFRWRWFNLKYAFSRRLIYAGLLFLMAEAGVQPADQPTWLCGQLRWTPLERITSMMSASEASRMLVPGVLSAYDRFMSCLQSDEFRQELAATSSCGQPSDNAAFADLMFTSQRMVDALWVFMDSQRASWSGEVFTSFVL